MLIPLLRRRGPRGRLGVALFGGQHRHGGRPGRGPGWPKSWSDVTNSPSWEDAAVMEFFDRSTRNLLAAEAAAGVKHHVALSVVGADRMPDSGLHRAKVNQENLIEAGGAPYSIVRATQFFEFLGGIADSGAEGDTVRLSTAPMQPLAADDVASAVADAALAPPVNGTVEVGGPGDFPSRRTDRQGPRLRQGSAQGRDGRRRALLRHQDRRQGARSRAEREARANTASTGGSPTCRRLREKQPPDGVLWLSGHALGITSSLGARHSKSAPPAKTCVPPIRE